MNAPMIGALAAIKERGEQAFQAYKHDHKGPYYEGQSDAFDAAV